MKNNFKMEKSAQIGKDLSGKHVYVPHLDETPVPCPDGYTCTNCVYCADGINAGYFSLAQKSDLTALINAMICRMEYQDREIEFLKQKINILSNNGNNR